MSTTIEKPVRKKLKRFKRTTENDLVKNEGTEKSESTIMLYAGLVLISLVLVIGSSIANGNIFLKELLASSCIILFVTVFKIKELKTK